jgi:hypothetical protein
VGVNHGSCTIKADVGYEVCVNGEQCVVDSVIPVHPIIIKYLPSKQILQFKANVYSTTNPLHLARLNQAKYGHTGVEMF